ncbi:MAG: hypothetical protein ACE5E1_03855 [Phycisphaerae bacterium]
MNARMPALLILVLLWPAALAVEPPASDRRTDAGKSKRVARRSAGRAENRHRNRDRRAAARLPRNLAVKAMKQIVADAEFRDLTFEEFAEWLGRETGANVVVRWRVLEASGVERDYPIALKKKNIAVRKLLILVFRQVTEDLPSVTLAAKADGNTLIISTRKNLNAKRLTRVYDVRDLLIRIPNFSGTRIGNLGLGGGGRFRLDHARPVEIDPTVRDPEVRRLIHLITTHIQPLSWKVHGGKGTIRYLRGRLIIYNNIEVHQRLAGIVSVREAADE